MEINKHIVGNLDYYLSLSSPEYAFLLCGEWGVGKTHFINEYIEKKSCKDLRLIKISLFGLKNTSEINSNIFQKLHPVLGSKYAKLAGNIIKGAFSMGVRFDLNSDGNSESMLNTKLDKLNLSDFLSDKKREIVLVLDDLERSQISTVEALGFINELVEISQVKVILVANEKALIESDDKERYTDFKEKVIGKTFEIKHDFSSILCEFLDGSSLSEYKGVIQDVYSRSNFKNLRKFKQSIDDFQYLADNIDNKYKENDEFYKQLVRCFFALSIEVKKGSLSEEELIKNVPFRKSSEEITNNDIYTKYFSEQARLYDGSIWASIIFKGDLNGINEQTSNLALFVEKVEKDIPSWVKLWNFRELEDEEFSNIMEEIESEIRCLTENVLNIYLHKIALVVYFSKNGLSKICIDEINNIVHKYIEKYRNSAFWKTHLVSGNSFSNGTGYGYFNEQDPDFISLKTLIVRDNEKYYNEEKQKEKALEAKSIVDSIVSSIKSDFDDGFTYLLLNVYKFKPILNKIDPKVFVSALMDANNATLGKINDVVCQRYAENHTLDGQVKYSYLRAEHDFWKGVGTELDKNLKGKNGLKEHILDLFLKYTVSKTIRLLSEK